jgi:hypothetical protein
MAATVETICAVGGRTRAPHHRVNNTMGRRKPTGNRTWRNTAVLITSIADTLRNWEGWQLQS